MGVLRRSRVPERITRPDERFDSSQVGLGGLYAVPGLTLCFRCSDYGTFYSHYRIL